MLRQGPLRLTIAGTLNANQLVMTSVDGSITVQPAVAQVSSPSAGVANTVTVASPIAGSIRSEVDTGLQSAVNVPVTNSAWNNPSAARATVIDRVMMDSVRSGGAVAETGISSFTGAPKTGIMAPAGTSTPANATKDFAALFVGSFDEQTKKGHAEQLTDAALLRMYDEL